MINYDIYVGGQFIKTSEILEVINPYDSKVFGTTYIAGKKELEIAITKGKSVEEEMKQMPSHKKYKILMDIADALIKDRDHIANILAQEAGKPLRYALGEIDRAAQTFVVAAEECKRLPSEYISIDWTPAGEGKEGFVKYFPLGLISGISPFNFPLNLAVHKIAPAIAAGNPIILKPARSTPLSVIELAKIIDNTDLPKGAVSIIPMDRVAGNQLVTDERFKMLTFTGSPEVGWDMKANAGNKKIALELGGNAGVILTKTTDIDKAVAKCLIGGFAYSGQVCIHVQRIFVDETIFDEFTLKYIEGVKKLKIGTPTDPETEISAMIDEGNAKRVEEWVKEAYDDGAKILYGGKRKDAFFEPTIITDTKKEMKVCSKEVFGPVVVLEKYSSFKQAIDDVNNSEFGLQAGVFTDSIDEMNYAYDKLEVGGVIINDVPTFRVDHMPYGGIKNSGLGREGVKYTIFEMMEPKLLVRNK